MSAVKELHIIVPGICGPLAETASLEQNKMLADWVSVLSKARCQDFSTSLYDVIAEVFGFDIDTDFPVATFELLATEDYDSDLSYLCADPVHLQADMDHAILTSSDDVSITDDESVELCNFLDQHFSQDGIRFIYRNKNRWMLSIADEVILSTTPLIDAVGRNVNFLLPRGESATYWNQLLTEAQMLLFSHEINADRESRGLSSINSLWLYGTGKLPITASCEVNAVSSDENLFRGIASHVQCEYFELPQTVSEYTEQLVGSDRSVNVLHLRELGHLTNYTDVNLWSGQLEVVLKNWLYPLMTLAKQKAISLYLYPCNGRRYQFTKYDEFKFWRRDKIEEHIGCY